MKWPKSELQIFIHATIAHPWTQWKESWNIHQIPQTLDIFSLVDATWKHPPTRASNAENVSISWRHYVNNYRFELGRWLRLRLLPNFGATKWTPISPLETLRSYEKTVLPDTETALGAPNYQQWLTIIRAWIRNYIHHKMWGEITYPFTNVNSTAVGVWRWISSCTFQGVWLLIHAGIEVNPCQ